jgi:uncharacterized membrane protein HdeD (DUF308 family)
MKDMLENYALGALACIVMGVALIVNPHIITDVLNTAIGVILIVWAVLGILRFIVSKVRDIENGAGVLSLFSHLVILAAGIYVFINTSLLEKIVMLALGLYLLCTGIPKIIDAVKIKSVDPDHWILPLITSVLTAVLGITIVISPTKVSGAFMRIVGIILVIAGTVSFISGFSSSRIYKKLEKDVQYSKGRGRDGRDTFAQDKASAIDVDIDD